ncbi:hypothetical protein HYU09_05125 [Candidatus Woesearchaeota archaeon]|nr:hypothetical protein [Candidatus Woesearchaeota archaeon]
MNINLKTSGNKSQLSMEFFMLAGLAFITVIIFVGVSAREIGELRDTKDFLLIKDLGLKLQKEVGIAAYVEDGYVREFTLPDKLDNSVDYSIVNILGKNNSITISTSKTVFSVRVPLMYGKNFTKGSNKVERISGKIYVNR